MMTTTNSIAGAGGDGGDVFVCDSGFVVVCDDFQMVTLSDCGITVRRTMKWS